MTSGLKFAQYLYHSWTDYLASETLSVLALSSVVSILEEGLTFSLMLFELISFVSNAFGAKLVKKIVGQALVTCRPCRHIKFWKMMSGVGHN